MPEQNSKKDSQPPDEAFKGQLEEIRKRLMTELDGDDRLQSGVPSDRRISDLDFIQMTGLTRPDLPASLDKTARDGASLDMDPTKPVSFFEKGIADVDSAAEAAVTGDASLDSEDLVAAESQAQPRVPELKDIIADLTRDEELVEGSVQGQEVASAGEGPVVEEGPVSVAQEGEDTGGRPFEGSQIEPAHRDLEGAEVSAEPWLGELVPPEEIVPEGKTQAAESAKPTIGVVPPAPVESPGTPQEFAKLPSEVDEVLESADAALSALVAVPEEPVEFASEPSALAEDALSSVSGTLDEAYEEEAAAPEETAAALESADAELPPLAGVPEEPVALVSGSPALAEEALSSISGAVDEAYEEEPAAPTEAAAPEEAATALESADAELPPLAGVPEGPVAFVSESPALAEEALSSISGAVDEMYEEEPAVPGKAAAPEEAAAVPEAAAAVPVDMGVSS